MIFKKFNSAITNQRGFTFIELMLAMGILGMLSAIAVQQFKYNRQNAFDSQTISIVRTLLTHVAIDEPTGVSTMAVGGNLENVGIPEVEVAQNVAWNVVNVNNPGNATHDMWQFWFAHPAGKMGYYFWIPGAACNATDDAGDGTGNSSDHIFYDGNKAANSYRNLSGLPVGT